MSVVKIRLRRVGRKRQPHYRIVVAMKENPRGGEYLDNVGYYNPRTQPAELRLDLEKVDKWLGNGAEMSETAASLIRKARKGGDKTVVLKPVGDQPREEQSIVGGPAPKKRGKGGSQPKPGHQGGIAAAGTVGIGEGGVLKPVEPQDPAIEPGEGHK